jgi:hypothetical protein
METAFAESAPLETNNTANTRKIGKQPFMVCAGDTRKSGKKKGTEEKGRRKRGQASFR